MFKQKVQPIHDSEHFFVVEIMRQLESDERKRRLDYIIISVNQSKIEGNKKEIYKR